MNLFTIPPGEPFLPTLAGWILEQYAQDDALFTRTLLLLPNRRSCRALRDAFLAATGGRPTLLPRILPINDMGEEDILIPAMEQAMAGIPRALAPMRRQLLLTRLVMAFERNPAGLPYSVDQAARLAMELARFMDDITRQEITLDGLSELVPEELAAHWQRTLEFLTLISARWPAILEAEQAIDPTARRNRLLGAAAAVWAAQPPAYPVIAAGIHTAIPAVSGLLAAIMRLPQGKVIFPGLDTEMPEQEWNLIGETHPQYGMKELLGQLGAKRRDVLPLKPRQAETSARIVLLRCVLQAPEATARWQQARPALEAGLRGMTVLTADTLPDEARMIASALRQALETPGKTAALVTPDRNLARMVAAQMRRFGVAIDDSAGQPLSGTPPACFLRLAADMALSHGAPAQLLALLRHPLASGGMNRAEFRRLSRALELRVLRGVRHAPGLRPLSDSLKRQKERHAPLERMVTQLVEQAEGFMACFEARQVFLQTLLEAHIAFAEQLAATDSEAGSDVLWAGDAGNQLAAFLAELRDHAGLVPPIAPRDYPGLLESLMAQVSWQPAYGLHPRLQILGQLEARLQHFDLVILGSLNEGSWPALPKADPWMSRPMHKAFGLMPAECLVGESAHDFAQLCAAPEVMLTRARKVEGAPSVPSRWLTRLETLVQGHAPGLLSTLHDSARVARCKELLDAPLPLPLLSSPAPTPPLAARPRRLRVTAVDSWLLDPYMVYAAHILKLRPLDALDEEPDMADFGNAVHKALELFTQRWPDALPQDAHEKLLACGHEAFSRLLDRPAVAALWWPRFEAMAGWIVALETERRRAGVRILAELNGEWTFQVDGKPFTLTTRIDRLELNGYGTATLVDYKTGSVPNPFDVTGGFANQLPLAALVAMHGALPATGLPCRATCLEYWKLAGNAERCEITAISESEKLDMRAFLEQTRMRLEALIRQYDDPQMPYAAQPDPRLVPRYNDYAHLTRRQEWEEA